VIAYQRWLQTVADHRSGGARPKQTVLRTPFRGGTDEFLVEGTTRPLYDAARALLAGGLASRTDQLVMRRAGSPHPVLTASIAAAAMPHPGPPQY
jgi:hypothetical protein